MDAALQQRIVGKIDARHHVRGTEGDLFGLGEEVVRIAVEHHPADRRQRHQLFGHDLGRVEHVKGEGSGLLLGEHLQGQLPLGIVARLDGFPQVAPVEVGIGANDPGRLVPHQRMRALQRRPVELDEARLPRRVNQAEGVHAETLHRAIAARDRPVRHLPKQHVGRFRHQRDEVPEGVVRAGRLRHRVMRLRLDGMHEVGELHGILDEEYRHVIADQVPVAFVGIELDGKAAHIAHGVGRAALACHGGKAHEHRRALAGLGQQRGARDRALVAIGFEEAMRGGTTRVDHPLGNAFMVEMGDLFAQDKVFQRGRPAQADLERILVVGDGHALAGGQALLAGIDAHAVERTDGRVGARLGLALAQFGGSERFTGGAAGSGRDRRPGGGAGLRAARRLAIFARLIGVAGHVGSKLLAGDGLLQ